jgi:hypothetical protein
MNALIIAMSNFLRQITESHFDLNIEHSISTYLQTQGGPDVLSKAFFVALFDRGPFCTECLVFGKWEKTFEPTKVLQPHVFLQLERLRDEGTQFGITLRIYRQPSRDFRLMSYLI